MVTNRVVILAKSYIYFFLNNPDHDLMKIYLNYLVNKLRFKIGRKRDISSEIFFWEHNYYKYLHSSKRPSWWNNRNPTYTYPPEMTSSLELLHKEFGNQLKIIDVGSGPISMLINKLDLYKYDVTTVDPLADTYNCLNSKYGIPYTKKCIECSGEDLDKHFPADEFHLVFSQNSIDHSENPTRYIKNLFRILKPNGVMYLSGSIREGTAQNWIGIHQHDLFIEGNDLYLTNRLVEGKNLTDNLNLKCLYKSIEGNSPGSIYTIVYRKLI